MIPSSLESLFCALTLTLSSEVISSIYFAIILMFVAKNLTVGFLPRTAIVKIIVRQNPNRNFFHMEMPRFRVTP